MVLHSGTCCYDGLAFMNGRCSSVVLGKLPNVWM